MLAVLDGARRIEDSPEKGTHWSCIITEKLMMGYENRVSQAVRLVERAERAGTEMKKRLTGIRI